MKKNIALSLMGFGGLFMTMFSVPSWLTVADPLSEMNWFTFGFGLVMFLLGIYVLDSTLNDEIIPTEDVCPNCGLQIDCAGDAIPICETCQVQIDTLERKAKNQ